MQLKIVIPMHYHIPNTNLNVFGLQAFTSRYPVKDAEIRQGATIVFNRDILLSSLKVVVLRARVNEERAI